MARPPVEWPIPIYVAEYRERLALTYRVPGGLLNGWVPAPLVAETVRGSALVVLRLASGRCLKPVGGPESLLGEFTSFELFTPVRWQAACRETLRGNLLLHFGSSSHGLCRLVRTALELDAQVMPLSHSMERGGHAWRCPGTLEVFAGLRTRAQGWSPDSVLAGEEDAEALLLHPAAEFVPLAGGRAVQAIPLHEYARSTAAVAVEDGARDFVADLLGADAADLRLDHALFQKRCTDTWSFPPERIPVVAAARRDGWRSGTPTLLRAA